MPTRSECVGPQPRGEEARSGAQVVGVQGQRNSRAPSPSLSKDAGKAIPVRDVVAALGLQRATGRDKFVCPKHGGGSLQVYPDNAFCFGGCGRLDNIALVRAALGVSFPGALHWLASTFPEACRTARGAVPRRSVGVDLDLQRQVLSFMIDNLTLSRIGQRFFEERRLDPDQAAAVGGFRSIDAGEWDDVRSLLRQAYTEGALEHAGLRGFGWFGPGAPWPQRVDALVIPYLTSGGVATIHLRCLSEEGDRPKYLAMKGSGTPAEPYGVLWVSGRCTGRRVHITRGEINAWTLCAEYDELALGTPGPRALRADWFGPLRDCSTVVIWGDTETSGEPFVEATRRALCASLGVQWLRTHAIERPGLYIGQDANGLHVEGLLRSVLEDLAR